MKLIFTVCNRDSIREALVLGTRLKELMPDWPFTLCWADSGLPEQLNFDLVTAEEVVGNDASMTQPYTTFEFCHAIRPLFARYLLRTATLDQLLFLAPTVYPVRRFDALLADKVGLWLTPALTQPLPKHSLLDDKWVLNRGMFRSDAWYLTPSDEVRGFIDWWCARVVDRARFDLCEAMNLDQLWLNYAPSYLMHWGVLRHGGWMIGAAHALTGALKTSVKGWQYQGEEVLVFDLAGVTSFHPSYKDTTEILRKNFIFSDIIIFYKQVVKKTKPPLLDKAQQPMGRVMKVESVRPVRKRIVGALRRFVATIHNYPLYHKL